MNPQRKAAQFDLPSGTMLGKYEVLRKLAMGGMAEIYLARSRGTAGFEKVVVIKRILPTVADDPNFVKMFLDEARLAATLQHPNIADVYEVGEDEGTPYFAMEFVQGQDVRSIRLASRERKENVPLAIALAIVHGTASALDYAHDRCGPDGVNLGLVHRDVSSSNVLVSYDGAIKLIDFGIARATSNTHQTQVGTLKGKIPYMSPEQCRGQPLDRRSDLFSLGVVMYELTAGRRPFRGENDFTIMDQIVHQGAVAPSTLMRGYPPELEAIVMKLLARKADDRYQNAEEMLHDLDPFLAQHRLWVSPKPLSRYMRATFADKIAAWDETTGEGVTLAHQLASSITSQSRQSELVTPPSSFPALLPLSQEMPAVNFNRSSDLMRAEPTPPPGPPPRPPTSAPVALEVPASVDQLPQLKPSGGKLVFVVVGVLALGIGGFFGLQLMQGRSAGSKAADVQRPDEPNLVMDIVPADEPKPVVAEPKPVVAEPKPVVAEPKPVVTPPVPRPVKTPPKVTPKPPPNTKPPKPDKPAKEPAWDSNSPFLPPSS